MPTETPWGYAKYDYPTVDEFLAANPRCAQGWPDPRSADPLPGHWLMQLHPEGRPGGHKPLPSWIAKFCRPSEGLSTPENTDLDGDLVAYNNVTGQVHVLEPSLTLAEAQGFLRDATEADEKGARGA